MTIRIDNAVAPMPATGSASALNIGELRAELDGFSPEPEDLRAFEIGGIQSTRLPFRMKATIPLTEEQTQRLQAAMARWVLDTKARSDADSNPLGPNTAKYWGSTDAPTGIVASVRLKSNAQVIDEAWAIRIRDGSAELHVRTQAQPQDYSAMVAAVLKEAQIDAATVRAGTSNTDGFIGWVADNLE